MNRIDTIILLTTLEEKVDIHLQQAVQVFQNLDEPQLLNLQLTEVGV
ncbi:MAG TPA: hypothetical protein VD884_21265 [Ohtaekwangia sp.]|nr:hypothetical protein [Ohtaekwangia sp.]